ncbi:unnamed protein product, partial [Prorocentrum cordatum]
ELGRTVHYQLEIKAATFNAQRAVLTDTSGDVRVLHADTRLLITKIRIFGQDEVIYVAHAPNIGHDTLDYTHWWEQLHRFCQQWPPSLILGDMNAKLGSLHHLNGVEDSTVVSSTLDTAHLIKTM